MIVGARARNNGQTLDIYTDFRSVGNMAGIHVRYASMKLILRLATTKPGLLLIKFFCGSEVAMKPYCK